MREKIQFDDFRKANKLNDRYSPEDLLFYYTVSNPVVGSPRLAGHQEYSKDAFLLHIKYISMCHLANIDYENSAFKRYAKNYKLTKAKCDKNDSVIILSFVQGVLWASYVFTRKELLEHSKGLK